MRERSWRTFSAFRYSMPSIGLLAVAYSFRGIRPALYANRPASTAYFIASAMAMGSFAPAMAVFMSTASAPNSIARAASDAVPTPASTMMGTLIISMMIFKLYGLRIPSPDPIGAANGMTAGHPMSTSFWATMGSSLV